MCLIPVSVIAGFVIFASGIEQYIDFCSSVAHVVGSSLVFDGSDAAINSTGTFPSGTSYCTCSVQARSLGLVGVVAFTHTTDDLYSPSSIECGKSIIMTSSGTSKSTVFGCASSTDFRRKDVITESTITLNMSITTPRPRDETYKLEINPGPFTPGTNGLTATCSPAEVPDTTTIISSSSRASIPSSNSSEQTTTIPSTITIKTSTSTSTSSALTLMLSTAVSQETSTPGATSSDSYFSKSELPSSASTNRITSTFMPTLTTPQPNVSSVTRPASITIVSVSPSTTDWTTNSSMSLSLTVDPASSSSSSSSANTPLYFETSEMLKQISTSSATMSKTRTTKTDLIAVSSGCAVALIVIIATICTACYFVCKRRRVKREEEMREEENVYQNIQMSRPSEQQSTYSAISQPYDSIGPLYWSFEDVNREPPSANGVSTFTAGEQLNTDNDNMENINDRRDSGVYSQKEYSNTDSVYSDGSARAKDITYDPGYLVPMARSVASDVSRKNSAQARDYIYPLPDYPS